MKRQLLATTTLTAVFVTWFMSYTPANAADLFVPAPETVYTPEPVSAFDWSGAYIGIHGGYSWGKGKSDPNFSENGPIGLSNLNGLLVGLNAGFNKQFSNNVVLGAEGDISYTDLDDKTHLYLAPDSYLLKFKSDWQASIRARAGYALDNTLLYVTGGVAFAGGKLTFAGSSDRNTHVGWTIGGGIEHAFTPNWFGRIEGRYTEFDKKTYDNAFGKIKHDFHQTSILFGIGYKF
jgi:outer membrane immunogenic protein